MDWRREGFDWNEMDGGAEISLVKSGPGGFPLARSGRGERRDWPKMDETR